MPVCINNVIQERGIFPSADEKSQEGASMPEVMQLCEATEYKGNYKSVDEHSAETEAELKKELAKGFMQFAKRKTDLEQEVHRQE